MKVKNSNKRRLEKKIFERIRILCFNRHNKCVVCGSDKILQAGHLIPSKSSPALRYDLRNIFTQCRNCNLIHRYNQAPYFLWYIKTFGIQAFENLVYLSKIKKKYSTKDLEKLLQELTIEVNNLKMKL